MITKPKIDQRAEQPYLGIRTQVRPSQFRKIIPQFLDEIFARLNEQGVQPASAPFMRYHVINMGGNMDVEIGVPVAQALPGTERIQAGVLPAGRYASVIYRNVGGITGNRALVEWAHSNGIRWDRWDDPNGDAFRCRVEIFLTDPAEQPDRKKWETEVAILLADQQTPEVNSFLAIYQKP